MIRMGIIGYGYWGPNIVRNFSSIDDARVVSICDLNEDILKEARRKNPGVEVTGNPDELLRSPSIDAVGIVTPVSTHFELAKKALQNGKHVFVEKPFTATADQAEELVELADKKKLKIMVDHTFLFTGAVKKIKELLHQDALGRIYYYDSMRVNLGLFQHDVNVIWDLAPHDLSIMDHILESKPMAVVATGENHFTPHEYVAYITIFFPDNVIAHFNVNWLSPVKVRTTLLGGEKKMLVWNDLEPDEKIKVYDKGVEVESKEGVYNLLVSYRSGDIWAPRVEQREALRAEAEYFCHCILNDETPFNDGKAGLRIVRILEAANESVRRLGEMIYL